MRLFTDYLPPSLIALVLALLLQHAVPVSADPATVPFTDCFDNRANSAQKLNVSTVYAQILDNEPLGTYLNFTVLGSSPMPIMGLMNTSGSLSTLFTTSSVLTINAWTNSSFLCNTLRPPSPLPPLGNTTTPNTYCPLPPGPFAFSSSFPIGPRRALTTLTTRLRAVDPSGDELVCIDVTTTPLHPSEATGPYGAARIVLWATVALAAAYWLVVGVARVVSAWGRGATRSGNFIWGRIQSGGFILASAVSGERMTTSPALMRFCTPSMRDVFFHTQWCAALAMVAVEWPPFIYPVLTQTAWSTLSYNITLASPSGQRLWNPLSTLPYSPPAVFSDQLSDPSAPIFVNSSVPNTLFTLPQNATHGIRSFAYALGVRPQDLFPNCLILFLAIVGATIVVSTLLWALDYFMVVVVLKSGSRNQSAALGRTRSPKFNASLATRNTFNKDAMDMMTSPTSGAEESKSLTGHSMGGGSMFGVSGNRAIGTHRAWWRLRSDIGAFHFSVLHGNLVRILVLFHLPITIFSVYQMVQHGPEASRTSLALAALSFTFFSVLIPLHLVLKVTFTTTNKLYDETRTLLSLGPLYNHYRHGSQMFAMLLFASNIAFGVTIGAGQKSGTAQAIVILVVEVISALGTSIWLPWGGGASMGLISFLFCVARIVIAVLLVILTPTISIGPGPGGWVAYGILIVLALVYLALLSMLVVKLMEAALRIVGGIGFDRSRHVLDSGLLGVLGLIGCCGLRARSKRRRRKSKKKSGDRTGHNTPMPPTGSYGTPTLPMINGLSAPSTPGLMFGSTDSRKGSTHSGPPPSVLRPEHALPRPYHEDEDDEGYIMGAWQSHPLRHGYFPMTEPANAPANAPPPATSQTKSGFTRVGGGRSHIDTPYAIMGGSGSAFAQNNGSSSALASMSTQPRFGNGSTHTFPSYKQQNHSRTTLQQPGSLATSASVFYDDDDPPPSLSNVARQPEYGTLPPGAMQPAHVRTKSQTAIIEDANGLSYPFSLPSNSTASAGATPSTIPGATSQGATSAPTSSTSWPNPPDPNQYSAFNDGDDDDDDDDDDDASTVEQPKKRPWYRGIIRHRYNSDPPTNHNNAQPLSAPIDSELGGIGSSSGDASASGSGSSPGSGATQPTRSFVVIRKPQP